MYGVQYAIKITQGSKSPAVSAYLNAVMNWLEKVKTENSDNDGIVNETCAHALLEEYTLKVFDFADKQDRAEHFDKYV